MTREEPGPEEGAATGDEAQPGPASRQITEGDGSTGDGALDEPLSRFAVGPDSSHEEFLAAAKLYARRVVDGHDLSVDVSDLEWSVSTRAKRRAGATRYRDGDPTEVVLAWRQFQSAGWETAMATLRHELVHVHLLNEAGDPGHGDRFRALADALDTHVRCERFAEPSWWVTCTDCGERLARYRRSKLVKNPGDYACGSCGGRLVVEEATDSSA